MNTTLKFGDPKSIEERDKARDEAAAQEARMCANCFDPNSECQCYE